jgi:ATP-dependent DNA ligase
MKAPVEPMLAKLAEALPEEGGWQYEPKWDGFRALVFRGRADALQIQSRDLRPLDRYFPELHAALLERLAPGCVLDGEIVVVTAHGLDFDALQQRLHPAASRVARLAAETAASFVAFDLLAQGGRSLMGAPQAERRAALEKLLARARPPLHLSPATTERKRALKWLAQFEGAGLDGVIAKPLDAPYQPGKRALLKVKHVRTADCVLLGYRGYKGSRTEVGSLLLGLHDERGELVHVGVASSFDAAMRKSLLRELAPLRGGKPIMGEQSRWSAGKDLSWQPLRPERVCEVKYDHLQGRRFRHATKFLRWRPDKPPADCRFDQLEVVRPFALAKVFGAAPVSSMKRSASWARGCAAWRRPAARRTPASPGAPGSSPPARAPGRARARSR